MDAPNTNPDWHAVQAMEGLGQALRQLEDIEKQIRSARDGVFGAMLRACCAIELARDAQGGDR
jgi:hypothetical protein